MDDLTAFRQSLIDIPYAKKTEFRTQSGEVHDRSKTVGASSSNKCLRAVAYDKSDHPKDVGYENRWGFLERGHNVEYWLSNLIDGLVRDRVEPYRDYAFQYWGDNQVTLVDGKLSATSDGLLSINRSYDASAKYWGEPETGTTDDPDDDEVAIEIKSIDPRSNLSEPKEDHVVQVQVQMDLYHKKTDHRPDRGWIIYVNASDYQDITMFEIRYDPTVADAVRGRVAKIFSNLDDPRKLLAEGKYTGECDYCAWRESCGESVLKYDPPKETVLDERDMKHISKLVMERDVYMKEIKKATKTKGFVEEEIKMFLHEVGCGVVSGSCDGTGFKVKLTTVAGRKKLDTAQIEEIGIDLSPFYIDGKESERLTISTMKEVTK